MTVMAAGREESVVRYGRLRVCDAVSDLSRRWSH